MAILNRIKQDNLIGIIVGANILFFIISSGFRFAKAGFLLPVGVCILAINLVTAVLLLIRKGFIFHPRMLKKPFWLISLLLNGVLFGTVQPVANWGIYANALFVSGTVFAVFSLLCLGRSFAIAPANREIVSAGAYKIVRHPAYLGEMLMALACLAGTPNLLALGLLVLLVISQLFRIMDEEQLLLQTAAYTAYSKAVKWRLVPFIW